MGAMYDFSHVMEDGSECKSLLLPEPHQAVTKIMLRWKALIFGKFHPTGQHANTDGLSHLPLQKVTQKSASSEPSVGNTYISESLRVIVKQIQVAIS